MTSEVASTALMICKLRTHVNFDNAMDQHVVGYCRYRLNLRYQTYSGSIPLQLPHLPPLLISHLQRPKQLPQRELPILRNKSRMFGTSFIGLSSVDYRGRMHMDH